MLSPNSRCLYTSALTPPPDKVFDEAIATTFSMDPVLLLEAPVHLAIMGAGGQSEPNPLAVLDSIRRYAKRITVYAQRGRIQVPKIAKPNAMFGFLEEMIVEVTAPGGGVFHPKVWAIRFASPDKSKVMYRLVVMSRNMTSDQCWDLSLQLEGTIKDQGAIGENNKPLADFFNALPSLAARATSDGRRDQAHRFAEELLRVQWDLPEGFKKLTFYHPVKQGLDWAPAMANRMVVISPFCADHALSALTEKTKSAVALISRPETMSSLRKDTLALFERCLHLDDAAETDDGEDSGDGEDSDEAKQPLATGLHAKAYLFETQNSYTHVVVGSANATNAALTASKNVEILVGLAGPSGKIGDIDKLLGNDGLGEYLVNFSTGKEAEIDSLRKEAEESVEKARSLIAEADLAIECGPGSKANAWALALKGVIPSLEGIVKACAWPITVDSSYERDILKINSLGMIALGEFSASSVTGLTAFELKTSHRDVTVRFVLNLPVIGLPKDRDAAITQTVIDNKEKFLRYLLLLLSYDATSGLDSSGGSWIAKWLTRLAVGEETPILEELTRVYSRHPERLSEVSKLVRDLTLGSQEKNLVIPEDFLQLWAVFESAIGERHD
jgi:hypothetical protein